MRYLFGPVNSRRLGRSLGIDLIPPKTCSYDCVYCECGATTDLTALVREYTPSKDIIGEIGEYLSRKPKLDAVTFAGSGEPTLHSGIGTVIDFIKDSFPEYRAAVLTNGSLLWKPEVRKRILRADVVMPSLDSVSDSVFMKLQRPVQGISPEMVVAGLAEFRREYSGEYILEIFIVPGLNDTAGELALLREACLRIRPDLVHLNSLDRPGTEKWVGQADERALLAVREFFRPLNVEIIGKSGRNRASDAD